jgi:DNA polymerase III subunit delta'
MIRGAGRPLAMPFSEYHGNERIVTALRGMLARERVPHALLFAGPRGIGKFTLARMFAQAANCERRLPFQPGSGRPGGDDFCGECSTCRKIGELSDPAPLVERGLEARGASPDTATVERVPLLVQTHPDVWLLLPDPVRLRNPVARPVLRLGQLRAVQRAAQFAPAARRRLFLLEGAETMTEAHSNAFLKILEEPPESSTLILMSAQPDALLPTIRSRCLQFFFAPLLPDAVERVLEARGKLAPAARRLAAQLSRGCPGAALSLDLEESRRLRRDALHLVERVAAGRDFSQVFQLTAQLTKGEALPFENLLELFYNVFHDLLVAVSGVSLPALRNPDLQGEIEALAKRVSTEWVARAVDRLDSLSSGLRRNTNRQLGLDSMAAALAGR